MIRLPKFMRSPRSRGVRRRAIMGTAACDDAGGRDAVDGPAAANVTGATAAGLAGRHARKVWTLNVTGGNNVSDTGTVLVTGAAGFVALNVVEALLAAGRRVVGLDRIPLPERAV